MNLDNTYHASMMLVWYPIPANPPMPRIPGDEGRTVEPCIAYLGRIRWWTLHRRKGPMIRKKKKRGPAVLTVINKRQSAARSDHDLDKNGSHGVHSIYCEAVCVCSHAYFGANTMQYFDMGISSYRWHASSIPVSF